MIPENYRQIIIDLFGDVGVEWLNNLPNLITRCERRWSLTALPPFELSYNYVAPAVRADGAEVVLKLGVPHRELWNEIDALRLWEGHGIVRLIDSDPEEGVMLLERLKPGTPLVTLEDDDRATRIFASVARQLWRPAPAEHSFPTVHDWADGMKSLREHFGGKTGPLPVALVETAETLFNELLASMAAPVLLHGDLHHWNILAAGREPWLALDPKGIVGEPCYEIGALLRNPLPGLFDKHNPGRVLARRVDQLADELGFDRQRIVGWGVAQAVLSAWWSIEDHGEHSRGWEEAMTCAELLNNLL